VQLCCALFYSRKTQKLKPRQTFDIKIASHIQFNRSGPSWAHPPGRIGAIVCEWWQGLFCTKRIYCSSFARCFGFCYISCPVPNLTKLGRHLGAICGHQCKEALYLPPSCSQQHHLRCVPARHFQKEQFCSHYPLRAEPTIVLSKMLSHRCNPLAAALQSTFHVPLSPI
jgi:hypothetical protein